MPVDILPLLIVVVLIGLPVFLAVRGDWDSTPAALGTLAALGIAFVFTFPFWLMFAPLLILFIPGLVAVFTKTRVARVAAFVSVAVVTSFILWISIPGFLLLKKARSGDAAAEYRYAKWIDQHHGRVLPFILSHEPELDYVGYEWLVKSSEQKYAPALYALGVRLKYGYAVPQPKGWQGPSGNVFPQPERGQALINEAIAAGYTPVVEEEYFYYHVYCGIWKKDPYD